MTRYFHRSYVIAIAINVVAGSAFAQKSESVITDEDRASLVRAKRIMRKFDKDGNGKFEKQENATAWKRYRKLDANQDQVLTIDELRKERLAYLETGGEQKLNIVYKQTSRGKLLLDLYYPTGNGKKGGARCPVIVYTHGGGWAAGSKQGAAKALVDHVSNQMWSKSLRGDQPDEWAENAPSSIEPPGRT